MVIPYKKAKHKYLSKKGKLNMLKSISFKKLAVLSAGIAIVLSSCGLQNDASDSSADATAAGKTKNFALSNGYCYDSFAQWEEANNAAWAAWRSAEEAGEVKDENPASAETLATEWAIFSPVEPHLIEGGPGTGNWDFSFDWNTWALGLEDGVPCPGGTTFAESPHVPKVTAKACYTQEFIDATVAGFTEQRDKPDASDEYKAEMQKGIDAVSGSCVKS